MFQFLEAKQEEFVKMHKKAYRAAVAQRAEGCKLYEFKSAQANYDFIALAKTITFPKNHAF